MVCQISGNRSLLNQLNSEQKLDLCKNLLNSIPVGDLREVEKLFDEQFHNLAVIYDINTNPTTFVSTSLKAIVHLQQEKKPNSVKDGKDNCR